MASLRKTRNKYYARISYTDEDSKKREKLIDLKTSVKEVAKEVLQQVETQEKLFKLGFISMDNITTEKPTSLSETVQEFYEYLKISDRSPKTIELYKYALTAFLDIFQGRELSYITREDSFSFIKGMKSKYPNNTTCNIRLRSIRAFLNWCYKTGRIMSIPFPVETLLTQKRDHGILQLKK